MPHFRYRALTRAGEVVIGEVEAPSREEVLRRIEYLGHLPIETETASKGILGSSGWNVKKANARDITIFLRQLALLVGSGLTLEAALQTLADDNGSKTVAKFSAGLRSSIAAGDGFAEALERHPTIIEPIYVAMVRAGEASGKLDAVLQAIVADRTRKELLGDRINSAIRYPLFLVGSAVLILFFFLLYVVPQFEPVFRDLGGKLNAGAAFVLNASTWLTANLNLFLGSIIIGVLVLWLIFSRRENRGRMVAMLSTLPGISGPMRDRRTARLISTLGLLVENGVALPAALKMLRDVVTEPRYVAEVDRVHDQVRNGRRFAEALSESDLLPPLAARMLRVGDETGDLPAITRHAAQFYEHRLGIGLDRLMGAIGPATIILVSVVIGALIVSIMSALLSITELAL
ncbi:type II secretion system F family protein [Rhodoplanes sp. Z2-YC6860]|uniref:type II secretion system F family protein n=1 Tax=Rhodoplanes sp. Z2-YC6860 TaxID=674703 RepID=UPI00078EEFD3|nr:type II secretion system F family protein [Rhodoplanes sp. Z2-YC6860]AMN40702.1 general secretion pathway protein F GspF [Rhodoplanes sp. Z2-YC6860]